MFRYLVILLVLVSIPLMGQRTGGAYWLANNPNAQITDAEVTALGLLTQTEIEILDGATVTTAELNFIAGMNNAMLDSLNDLTAAEIDMLDGINGAASGFWEGAPIQGNFMESAFWYVEDFIGVKLDSLDGIGGGSTKAQSSVNATLAGWNTTADSGHTLTQTAGSLGGQLIITHLTGSNNEFYMQLGELGTETFVEITESSGAELWFEVSAAEADTSAAGNFIIGLAEEGSASANMIADAGNDIGDKDFVGFVCWEDKPDTVEVLYQTSGGTFVDTFGYKIGEGQHQYQIYFDGDSTITFYVDGTSLGTVEQDTKLFPDTEELSPIIGTKGGAGDKVMTLDWIRMVSEISR